MSNWKERMHRFEMEREPLELTQAMEVEDKKKPIMTELGQRSRNFLSELQADKYLHQIREEVWRGQGKVTPFDVSYPEYIRPPLRKNSSGNFYSGDLIFGFRLAAPITVLRVTRDADYGGEHSVYKSKEPIAGMAELRVSLHWDHVAGSNYASVRALDVEDADRIGAYEEIESAISAQYRNLYLDPAARERAPTIWLPRSCRYTTVIPKYINSDNSLSGVNRDEANKYITDALTEGCLNRKKWHRIPGDPPVRFDSGTSRCYIFGEISL